MEVICDLVFTDASARPHMIKAVGHRLWHLKLPAADLERLARVLEAEPSLWRLTAYGARAQWARSVADVLEPVGDLVVLAGLGIDGAVTRCPSRLGWWIYTWARDGKITGSSGHKSAGHAVLAAVKAGLDVKAAVGVQSIAAARAVHEHLRDLGHWQQAVAEFNKRTKPLESWESDPRGHRPKITSTCDSHEFIVRGPAGSMDTAPGVIDPRPVLLEIHQAREAARAAELAAALAMFPRTPAPPRKPTRFDGEIAGKRAQLIRAGDTVEVYRESAEHPGLLEFLGYLSDLERTHPKIAATVQPTAATLL